MENLLSSPEVRDKSREKRHCAGERESRFMLQMVTGNVEENQAEGKVKQIPVFFEAAHNERL